MINGFPGNVELNEGDKPPISILPMKTAAGALRLNTELTSIGNNVLSGALTADVYKEIVSLSTSGVLRLCGVKTENGTSRTLGLKIVIDGVTVFDETSGATTVNDGGFWGVGFSTNAVGGSSSYNESFKFNRSLSLQIKSSLSETDLISLIYMTAVT